MTIVFLCAAGAWFLLIAIIYANHQVSRAYLTSRQATDFSGDVASWLRTES